jgi:hypothetical protein
MARFLLIPLIFFPVVAVCVFSEPASRTPIKQSAPVKLPKMKQFEEFIEGNRLSYRGYQAAKLHKKVRIEDFSKSVEITYAHISRNGKTLSKFDGFEGSHHPLGSDIDFGLFALLNNGSKQLVIEQTQWRNWAHWIVDFSPRYRVVFDSSKWGVGRELLYADLDGDGVYEISQAVQAFVFFENLTNGSSHLVDVVFKYDREKMEYLPANQVIEAKTLGPIEDEAKDLKRDDERTFAPQVLSIMLRYIYAGREKEAWSFYNREYNFRNKSPLRAKIKSALKDEPVHRFIYRQSAS